MPDLLLGFAAYKRTGFPEAITLNCLSEKSPVKPSAPDALISRPGMEDFQTVGTAPFRGAFQRDGLLDGQAFVVASDGAYLLAADGSKTALTGAIGGDDLVEIDGGLDADYNSVIRIATGGALYKFVYPGTSVASEDFPIAGGAGATSVAFFQGYWIASEAESDALYYQNPAETTWNAVQFASAEYAPDQLKGVRVFGALAALLGSATTEFWALTGSASSPLEKAGGLEFDLGCRNISAAANCGGTLIWVTQDCAVVSSAGGAPQLISDNGLSEQIRNVAAADLSATYFIKDQHPCFVLHLGNGGHVGL
jgi:hypothetical protein